MIGRGRPLLSEILGQSDRVGSLKVVGEFPPKFHVEGDVSHKPRLHG